MILAMVISVESMGLVSAADFPKDNDSHDFEDVLEDGDVGAGLGIAISAAEVATKKPSKKPSSRKPVRRPFVPMKKKGALAFDNAADEMIITRTELGGERLEYPLRLLVHAVQDDTNKEYIKEVEPFLRYVFEKRLPFGTPGERDITLASELDRRCFVDRSPLGKGVRLYHGLVHMFPEWRSELPISLRALHSWEKFQETWEGGPASIDTIYFVASEAVRRGFPDEGLAFLLAYDCYLREQDWLQLRAEDVHVSMRDSKDPFSRKVAILLGRRHRGESVKTGQEQGVAVDDPVVAALIAHRVSGLRPDDKVFDTSAVKAGRVWREILADHNLSWVGPMHTLRHSGPSHDCLNKRRSIAEIQRRGRWSQAKSMARYSKPHALIIHESRVPKVIRARGRAARFDLVPTLNAVQAKSKWKVASNKSLEVARLSSGDRASQAFEPLEQAG